MENVEWEARMHIHSDRDLGGGAGSRFRWAFAF